MKQLREHFLRELQTRRLAALPMHHRIRIAQTLNARPTECTYVDAVLIIAVSDG